MGVNPADTHKLYDQFVLAGKKSPGVCHFKGLPKRELGWEKQKAKGEDGASVVNNGVDLAEFSVELELWKDSYRDEFTEWDKWRPILETQIKEGSKSALDIYHPQLAELGIKSVVVKSWTAPSPDGKGAGIAEITFLEYAPKKKKSAGSPKGSKGEGGYNPAHDWDSLTDGEKKIVEGKYLHKKMKEQLASGDKKGALDTYAKLEGL